MARVILSRRKADIFSNIVKLIEEESVETVVIGHPLTLNGQESHAVAYVKIFAEGLREVLPSDVPIVFWDERLSTAQAQRTMIAAGVRREKRKDKIDAVAAAIVLQSYLDAQASGRC